MRSSAIIDRVTALLERTAPFDRFSPETRQQMLGSMLIEYFAADEVILEQGRTGHEFLYIVESGFVRLLDTDTQLLVDECREGSVFGGYGLVRRGALPYEARAIEPTVCILLRAEHFQKLYAAHEDFAGFFDGELSRYTRTRQLPLDASSARLLFGTRLGDLIHRPPLVCDPGRSAREAAQMMRRESADSVVVVKNGEVVGILSDIDLRNKLVAEAASAEAPVGRLMSERVIQLRTNDLVFDALMAMMHERAYHVVVIDEYGSETQPLGVISDQDISRAQGHSPAFMLERAERAGTVAELSHIRNDATELLLRLRRQGVQPRGLTAINTEINDRLMTRVLGLVESELREASPEVYVELPWVWLSLGSEGRGEMGLGTDQDNALVYADPSTAVEAERAEQWFRMLAERANLALAECGFSLCKGGIMARNPKWRQPLGVWTETFRRWILEPEAHALMEAGIFFDLRGLYGEMSLVKELKGAIKGALQDERRFLPLLARNALVSRPPTSLFHRFAVERLGENRHTFDIKQRGIRPLVDVARLFAMQLCYLDSANTFDRLQHASRTMPEMSKAAEDATEAYGYLIELRFDRQLLAIECREEPNNRVNPYRLNETQQGALEAVFSTIKDVQDTVAHRYGAA